MGASVDITGIDKLTRDLHKFARKAVPYAAADGANRTAFAARGIWVDEIKASMTLRNRFTLSTLRVQRAKPGPLAGVQAVLGSTAPYMRAQEEGASKQIGGKRAIPTSAAAGQYGARPRTKLVRRPNLLKAISVERGRGGSRPQRNAMAIAKAKKLGKRFVLLEGQRGKGLFKLVGNRRNPKVHMLWDLSRGSRPVPRNPTLGPTVAKALHRAPAIYYRAIMGQLKYHKVLGY